MKRLLSMTLAGAACLTLANGEELVKLPSPDKTGGKPLMQALNLRKSARNFSAKPLSLDILSNLLWAAQGVNRDAGHRTAPTSKGSNEIDVYVVLAEGVFLYQPEGHSLKPVAEGDFRAAAGVQDFVANVPVNLVYVADYNRQPAEFDLERKKKVALADTGFIGQNVYLYCASEGLISVFRAMVDAGKLGRVLKLKPGQEVYFSQSVGYPDEA